MSKKILIVRLSAIGDVIHTTPVARQVRLQHPDCQLDWVVEPKALAGIAHNPHLNSIITVDSRRPSSLLKIWRQLRGRYDITIDPQCLLKSGLVTALVKAPQRLGCDDAREGTRWIYNHHLENRWDWQYISQQYLYLASPLGVDLNDYVPELHLPSADREAADRLLGELGLDPARPLIALIAFSAEPTREWPPAMMARVGMELTRHCGAQCLIMGNRAEVPRAEALMEQMGGQAISLAGRTTLSQAAAVLQRCRLAIGPDTGLIHYSFALGTPLVCLLGPSPLRNGPKSDRAITLWSPFDHRPCRPSDRCQRGEGRPCMDEITVPQVFAAATDLLTRTQAPLPWPAP